jgi:prepilin-type N-terminal cleavage/methylation domain-containing protein
VPVRTLRALFPVTPASSGSRLEFAERGDDTGLTLIELVVAMMVFALLSIGVAYTMLASLGATQDARGRQVAANLAAQEIDLVRAIDDVFKLVDSTREITVDGVPYTLARTTSWVDSSGAGDNGCTTNGGALQYKRVNVEVSWRGMTGDTPVRADTLVAPSDKINDPTKGTILVRVYNRVGAGQSGIAVSAAAASPANGAVTPAAGVQTDAQGCAYLRLVMPGNYTVKVQSTGYIDANQSAAPTALVGVAAGGSSSVGFEYDASASVTIGLASNQPTGTVRTPTNMAITMASTHGIAPVQASSFSKSGRSWTLPRYPFSSGYELIAGTYVAPTEASAGCASVDPNAWPVGSVAEVPIVGVRTGPVAVSPGGSVTVGLPMGIVEVKTTSVEYVNALATRASAPADSGDPGCSSHPDLTFTGTLAKNSTYYYALPFGSWSLKSGSTILGTTADVTVTVLSGGSASAGVLTFDPRVAS